jgi:hypothetical protein
MIGWCRNGVISLDHLWPLSALSYHAVSHTPLNRIFLSMPFWLSNSSFPDHHLANSQRYTTSVLNNGNDSWLIFIRGSDRRLHEGFHAVLGHTNDDVQHIGLSWLPHVSFSLYADRCDDSTDLSHPKSGTLGASCAAWGKPMLELSLAVSPGIILALPVCCGPLCQLKSWDSCLFLRRNIEK